MTGRRRRAPRHWWNTHTTAPVAATVAYGTALLLAALLPLTPYLPHHRADPDPAVTTLTRLQPAAVADPAGIRLPAGYTRTVTPAATYIHPTGPDPDCWTLTIPTHATRPPLISRHPHLCTTTPSAAPGQDTP